MPTRPPFDPEIAEALAARGDVVTTLLPEQIGDLRDSISRPTDAETTLHGALQLTEYAAIAADGRSVRILLLRPAEGGTKLPVMYFVHGGGLVVGTAYDDLPTMAALAHSNGFALASVEYRLAPEHPYPAAVEDVYTGLVWLAANASRMELDPTGIIITGVSAGGGLAAAATLLARDRGGPALAGQMLLCPMLDDRNDTDSAVQMSGVGAWDRTANTTGWSAYLTPVGPDVPMYAAPARAEDLSDLPPTFIEVGSAETFRTENVHYAQRLWRQGGDAELHVWPGGAHGFVALAPMSRLAHDARASRDAWLGRVMAHRPRIEYSDRQ